MNPAEELPNDLRKLEAELAADRPQAGTEFRAQLLGAMQYAAEPYRPPELRGDRWAFAVGVAASVLVWMNLSLSATSAGNIDLSPAPSSADIARLTEEIRRVVPELPEREARRQALLASVGGRAVFAVELPAPTGSMSVPELE